MTCRRIAFAFAFALGLAAPVAHADEPPDFAGFKNLFYDQVTRPLDAKIAESKATLDDPNTPESAKAELRQAHKELETLKRRVEDTKTVEALYGSVKSGFDAVKEIAKEADSKYNASSAMHIGTATVDEISKLSSLKKLTDGAGKAIDIGLKLKAFSDDLDAIETSELSPGAKRLAKSMTVLSKLMSELGGKVPLIGDFVKAYGDVGGELLKVTTALDGKIKTREGGQMIDGVHGDRGNMLDLLRKMPGNYDDAERLRGLRDVFKTNTNDLVIWDPKARNWVKFDVDEAELRRRYLYYAKKGIKNPEPATLLQQFRTTVELWLEASKTHITPGETITLTPTATRVSDDRNVENAYVTITLADHSGIGSGAFKGDTSVQVGKPVTWTAPNNTNEKYRFEAHLDDATKGALTQARSGKEWVYTGDETKLSVKVTPARVESGGEVAIDAVVTGGDGKPLDAGASGQIEIDITPAGGSRGNRRAMTEGKGIQMTWTAPSKAGTYTVAARYAGATGTAWFGSNTAGAEATATIEVTVPRYSFTVSPEQQQVKKDETAAFEVKLTNEGEAELEFVVAGRQTPNEQARYWRVTRRWKKRVKLAGGASETFSFTMTPTDAKKSKRLSIDMTAAPKGVEDLKKVSFSASKEGGDKMRVAISAKTKQGKARGDGKGEYAPGDTIKLSFRPWGERREFCAKTVIETNKRNRSVDLAHANANGCSYGTKDGRLSSTWKAEEDEVTWSGPHTKAGKPSNTATFTVPEEPGTYVVNADGKTEWKLDRKTAAGRASDKKTDRGSATFTIEVTAPE